MQETDPFTSHELQPVLPIHSPKIITINEIAEQVASQYTHSELKANDESDASEIFEPYGD